MSRIGKKAIVVPAGVEATLKGKDLVVKGPKGTLSMTFMEDVIATLEDGKVIVEPNGNGKQARSMWGMQRTIASNLFDGVVNGFSKKLELNGVGYRAMMEGKRLKLQLGFSHDVFVEVPEGIKIECPSQTNITVSGIDKQKVGQIAAEIREWRKPEPYKGKGVRYVGEFVRSKEGKKK
jgi:large subunit ribosomal protein L6